ncbi:MAG: DegQ family serine endoprotease [Magnetovibrionaceae bacterium]
MKQEHHRSPQAFRSRAKAVSNEDTAFSQSLLWLAGLAIALAVFLAANAAHARSAPDSFADLAERLLPSVVNISTTQTVQGGPQRRGPDMPQLPPGSPFEDFFKDFFDRNQPEQRQRRATSLGSGFVIDAQGYIVTNNHVIEGADEITVILQDDTRLPATLIGRDPKTDTAVLKVEPNDKLVPTKWGNSSTARVGDWVVAIGNPFGLGGSVTAGIISARGRDINSGPYDDFIQTDASINRGNSGGPLFNMDGEVIGINTAIFSPTGGSVGIGFSIPTSTSRPVVEQLIKHGEVKRGWLGVHIQVVTDDIAEALGLDKASGALVASVMEGGPAEEGEIKPGDVILSFNGRDVEEMRRLPRIVADTAAGEEVEVEIWRDGKKRKLEITVGALEEDTPQVAARTAPSDPVEETVDALGLTLSSKTDAVSERFNLGEASDGAVVVNVDQDGPSAEKGIRPGDIITEVFQEPVTGPGDVMEKVSKARDAGHKVVTLMVEGQGGLRFVAVRIDG